MGTSRGKREAQKEIKVCMDEVGSGSGLPLHVDWRGNFCAPVTASAEEARGCAQHTMNGIHAGTMTGLYILIKFFGGMVHMVRCMRTAVFTIYMMKFILDVPCADTLIMIIR